MTKRQRLRFSGLTRCCIVWRRTGAISCFGVARSIDRLARNGFLETQGRLNGLNYPMFVMSLTERALRATGEWPAENVMQDLAQMLNAEADRVAVAEPEKASRLRQAANAVLRAD